jgi:2-keto-4-pentenoate hydratase
VRDLIGADDLNAAYEVQQVWVRARVSAGARIVGRKIGATSLAVQQQLGVDQPDFGYLLDDMAVPDDGSVPWGDLLQPRVEAEVAFLLDADLDSGELGPTDVAGSVAGVRAAIEIVDSRIAGWDVRFADTVADNASSGLFVLGSDERALGDIDLAAIQMELTVDGVVTSSGTGEACLGSPLRALSWLARQARDQGDPLRAGQVVLSGALGPLAQVSGGQLVRARLSGLGQVSAQF